MQEEFQSHEKWDGQTDRRTDRQTDRRTDGRNDNIPELSFESAGIIRVYYFLQVGSGNQNQTIFFLGLNLIFPGPDISTEVGGYVYYMTSCFINFYTRHIPNMPFVSHFLHYNKTRVRKCVLIFIKTRGSQEPVIAHLAYSCSENIDH